MIPRAPITRAVLTLACVLAGTGGGQALAAEAGQTAGMPQFDLSRFPSQIFWLGVTFLVLYWVMSKVALPRIGEVLDARANRIGGDLDRAAALKAEADQIRAAYEKALGESRAKAQEVGRATEAALAKESADSQATLGNELAGRVRAAEDRIAAAKKVAMANLAGVAAEAATMAVERVSGLKVSATEAASAAQAALARR
jgi:F-type H+-transporting ATPase subunit b